MFNNYTNPNTNPRILTLNLTLTDPHDEKNNYEMLPSSPESSPGKITGEFSWGDYQGRYPGEITWKDHRGEITDGDH